MLISGTFITGHVCILPSLHISKVQIKYHENTDSDTLGCKGIRMEDGQDEFKVSSPS